VHVNATASQVYQIIISLIPCISALAHRILSARMKHGEARHVIVYDGDDEAYLNWLSEHPEGFVLNAKRTGTDGACSIHRATCGHILVMRNQATVGGFTQRGGIKLCSDSIDALIAHIAAIRSLPLIEVRRCKRCEATPLNVLVEKRAEEFLPALPGGAVHIQVNAYERNPLAIALCIQEHGARCKVCDVDLEQRYGIVANGAMQVHFEPAPGRTGVPFKLDPRTDLVPICPYCHVMLHRGRDKPLRVEDLKRIMDRKRRNAFAHDLYRDVE